MDFKEQAKRFWNFLKEDSWSSFFVSMILILIFIKLIFFPALTFLTGSALPLVIVESCSMYHSVSLEDVMQDKIYADYGLSLENTSDWVLKRGFSKGDIIFIIGKKNVKVGDVIVFDAGQANPIIHRVIAIDNQTYTTKGDHNHGFLPYEKNISDQQVFGKAVFRIPLLGWVKLFFFDIFKDPAQRGLCK
ncbi:signal peptidase I [Candidatus Pacearchaeota archaeon]|nr:signal peptidase I [Candidatus Pacearchaeota archaeon]